MKHKNKGWREKPDASGKAPRHRAVQVGRKTKSVSKSPMVKSKPIVESIRVMRVEDTDPDLSWLTQFEHSTDPEEQKYYLEDKKRLASYGDKWVMYGIHAEAIVRVPTGNGYILQTIRSGGHWGIESDREKSYFKEVGDEQLAELKGILKTMKIKIPFGVNLERLEA